MVPDGTRLPSDSCFTAQEQLWGINRSIFLISMLWLQRLHQRTSSSKHPWTTLTYKPWRIVISLDHQHFMASLTNICWISRPSAFLYHRFLNTSRLLQVNPAQNDQSPGETICLHSEFHCYKTSLQLRSLSRHPWAAACGWWRCARAHRISTLQCWHWHSVVDLCMWILCMFRWETFKGGKLHQSG